jgi:hypothetical protein
MEGSTGSQEDVYDALLLFEAYRDLSVLLDVSLK